MVKIKIGEKKNAIKYLESVLNLVWGKYNGILDRTRGRIT